MLTSIKYRSELYPAGTYKRFTANGDPVPAAQEADKCRARSTLATDLHDRTVATIRAAYWQSIADAQARKS